MPELITDFLLVAEPFVHAGEQYERGDRLPVRHRWVRLVARAQPELFRMEYAPEDVDLTWLDSLEDESEERYQAILRAREEEKKRAARALRDELKEQERPQPILEARYAKQQAERKRKKEQAREEREREQLERTIALTGPSGFHF